MHGIMWVTFLRNTATGCTVRLEQNKVLFIGGATEESHDVYLSTSALVTFTKQ